MYMYVTYITRKDTQGFTKLKLQHYYVYYNVFKFLSQVTLHMTVISDSHRKNSKKLLNMYFIIIISF